MRSTTTIPLPEAHAAVGVEERWAAIMRRMAQRLARALSGVVAVLLALAVAGLVVVDAGDGGSERAEDYARGRRAHPHVADDGRFRADFPTAPERRTRRVEVRGAAVTVVDYTSGSGDDAFTVSFADIPAAQEVGDPVVRLKASARGAADAVQGELESSTVTSVAGLPAVEYVISVDDRFVKATSMLSGRRLYGIQVVGTSNPPLGYDRLRSSFRLAT